MPEAERDLSRCDKRGSPLSRTIALGRESVKGLSLSPLPPHKSIAVKSVMKSTADKDGFLVLVNWLAQSWLTLPVLPDMRHNAVGTSRTSEIGPSREPHVPFHARGPDDAPDERGDPESHRGRPVARYNHCGRRRSNRKLRSCA